MAKRCTAPDTERGIMDPIYTVGSVVYRGERRFVECHGGWWQRDG